MLAGGKIILAGSNGDLVSVNPTDGGVIETVNVETPINVAPVIADGTLYLLGDDGTLIARR